MRNVEVVGKLKHISCSNFFPKNLSFYGVKGENLVEPGRPQMTI
jgi:hypothetical protein